MGLWKHVFDPRYFVDECIECFKLKQNRFIRTGFLQVLKHDILIHNRNICPICGKQVKKMYIHIYKMHMQDLMLICSCLYNVVNNILMKYIVRSGGVSKPYKCRICGKRFSSVYEIFRHLAFEHFKDEICRCLPRYTVWCKQ